MMNQSSHIVNWKLYFARCASSQSSDLFVYPKLQILKLYLF